MTAISDVYPCPWRRSDWTGNFISVDGTEAGDFTEADVSEVVAFGSSDPDDWDGDTAGIVRLYDGRFVSWEAFWGPTGNGFSRDAYGGESDLYFSASVESARAALSEGARDLLAREDRKSVV